jgi:hydrogenase-4 component B
VEWMSIVPIAESRSSYNGLLVFVFMAVTGMVTAFAIHRLASDKIRRGPAWGCGYPDASPLTQYSASSFAQPIRRVFGSLVFRAREIGEMPPPGSSAPARLTVQLRDLIWDTLYAPIGTAVGVIAERLNYLQFLTIRSYLTLVFGALVILLLVLAIWP